MKNYNSAIILIILIIVGIVYGTKGLYYTPYLKSKSSFASLENQLSSETNKLAVQRSKIQKEKKINSKYIKLYENWGKTFSKVHKEEDVADIISTYGNKKEVFIISSAITSNSVKANKYVIKDVSCKISVEDDYSSVMNYIGGFHEILPQSYIKELKLKVGSNVSKVKADLIIKIPVVKSDLGSSKEDPIVSKN